MKAVLCPICNGKGRIYGGWENGTEPLEICPGCGGKGWVEVQDILVIESDKGIEMEDLDKSIKEVQSIAERNRLTVELEGTISKLLLLGLDFHKTTQRVKELEAEVKRLREALEDKEAHIYQMQERE